MKRILLTLSFALCLGGVVLSTSSTTFAQDACQADREKLCGNIKKGDGRIMQCMKDNEAKVSAECKAQWAKRAEGMKEVREACAADREKLCTGKVGPDLHQCMIANKDKVSAECKTEIEKMFKKHSK